MPQERTRTTEERPAATASRPTQLLGAGARPAPARRRYVLGLIPGAETDFFDVELIPTHVTHNPDIQVVREVKSEGRAARTLVLEMAVEAASRLNETIARTYAQRGVVLEEDAFLRLATTVRDAQRQSMLSVAALPVTTAISVVGRNDEPLADARVSLIGSFGATHGVTDSSGQVQLREFDELQPPMLDAIQVRPRADYWSYWGVMPALDLSQSATVRLAPLDQAFPQFPNQPLVGWGLKAMRVDALPQDQFDGRGVTVALLDSGCANRHRNLRHVEDGGSGWTEDEIGHGTHCAGIIVGGGATSGIRGIAPAVRLLPYKVFPRGRVSDLIEALDAAIQRRVDVISISCGIEQGSTFLEQKLVQAKANGIACIAATGDSAGPVNAPASSRNVLGVSAVGWRAAFPSDSQHTQAIPEGGGTQDGYFVARFTCFGPEVDVCGPGVAVVSSVPTDNFGALDGTAIAAAHVSGLAALVLAHHPEFKADAPYGRRDQRRVERLFSILKASAQPFRIGDTNHTGHGLPDAPRALNVTTGGQAEDIGQVRIFHDLANAARLDTGGPGLRRMEDALQQAGLSNLA